MRGMRLIWSLLFLISRLDLVIYKCDLKFEMRSWGFGSIEVRRPAVKRGAVAWFLEARFKPFGNRETFCGK